MSYRHQILSFQHNIFPFSSGFVPFLFNRKYSQVRLGSFISNLSDILKSEVGLLKDTVDFTIVNVYSPKSRFSHGLFDKPLNSVITPNTSLSLTFSLSIPIDYTLFSKIKDIQHRSNRIIVWSCNIGQFVTINYSYQDCTNFKLFTFGPNELQYIYNVLGFSTKNFAKFKSSTALVNPKAVLTKPFINLVRAYPIQYWAYNLDVWKFAPNLIDVSYITPELALYYFRFLKGSSDVVVLDIFDSLVDILSDGLLELANSYVTKQLTFTPEQLLAANAIKALASTGISKITIDEQYLKESCEHLIRNLPSTDILVPPQLRATEILVNDPQYAQLLRQRVIV